MKNFLKVLFKSILLVTILITFSGIYTSLKSINSNTNSCFKSESPDVLTAIGTVTGTVYDGLTGLSGVTVVEAGTFNGTTTDVNGHYSINVDTPNTSLIYRKLGYYEQSKVVNGPTPCVINVFMMPE